MSDQNHPEVIAQKKAGSTVLSFIRSYKNKPESQNNQEWLVREFKKYPTIWSREEDIVAAFIQALCTCTAKASFT